MNRRVLIVLNLIIAAFLIISFYASRISPVSFWPGSFLSFFYPYLALVNVFFIVFWLLVKRRIALISILSLILTFNGVMASFSLPLKQESGEISVMSYNVKNFDLYNWSRNKETRQKMLDIIQKQKPDIICFQEFFTNDKDEFNNIKRIHEEYGYKYFHYEETAKYKKNHWGAATFSKYPIINKGQVTFPEGDNNMSIFTDIRIKNDTFRIYNLHLQSYYMVEEDYEYLKSISDFKRPDKGSLFNILKKLKTGFVRRSRQADIIKRHIESFPAYKIVCGDFNDVPVSYSYSKISKHLKDAFIMRAAGMGKTFVSSLPSLRIDYILVDRRISVEEYRRLPYKYSDHYPIMISFSY